MSDLSTLAAPLAGGTGLDQLERAVADSLTKLKPGRRGAAAVREEMHRLVLADAVVMELSPQVSVSALARVVRRLRPSPVIDEALKKSTQAHVAALSRAGVPASVLELLQSWVEVTVDARVLQRQIEVKRAIESVQAEAAPRSATEPVADDPAQPMSAAELGQALGGLSDETVRQRVRGVEVFSVLRPGRKRGREYPAFQAWPGIAGAPLARMLSALGMPAAGLGTAAYGFFTSPTDLLGGLTPIEAMLGRLTATRQLEPETQALLAATPEERLEAVVKAAEAHAAIRAA
jgi:hypothetical protein